MKYRKLRIAWSVGWGVVCLLMIALWVRSYWWGDSVSGFLFRGAPSFALMTYHGEFHLTVFQDSRPSAWKVASLDLVKYPIELPQFGFSFEKQPNLLLLSVPVWFSVLISEFIVAASWLPWRFSLRTLLFLMTLIGVGLGLARMLRT